MEENLCPKPPFIPYSLVDTTEGLKGKTGEIVFVASLNTTYYMDLDGSAMVIHSAPIPYDNYDYETNPLGVRSNSVLDFENNREIYYDSDGEYRLVDFTKYFFLKAE